MCTLTIWGSWAVIFTFTSHTMAATAHTPTSTGRTFTMSPSTLSRTPLELTGIYSPPAVSLSASLPFLNFLYTPTTATLCGVAFLFYCFVLWQESREKSNQNHLSAFEGVKIHIKWHYYLQSKREDELWWHSPCFRSRLTFHLRPRENLHKILLLPLLQSATTYIEKSIRDCIHRYRQRVIDEKLSEINSTTTVPNVTQLRRGI